MLKRVILAVTLLLAFFLFLQLAGEMAPVLAGMVLQVEYLFHTATHSFGTAEGKISAILFIACFVVPGWAYSRLKKMGRRRYGRRW
jgi:hypothetical protein